MYPLFTVDLLCGERLCQLTAALTAALTATGGSEHSNYLTVMCLKENENIFGLLLSMYKKYGAMITMCIFLCLLLLSGNILHPTGCRRIKIEEKDSGQLTTFGTDVG